MVLFESKSHCCGCGACAAVCPKNAIYMREDEYGFRYPEIVKDKCIECGLCKKICAIQNDTEKHMPKAAFVATNKNVEQLMKSASGGVFSALAEKALKSGWIVWGAAYEFDTKGFVCVKHDKITTTDELYKLQGSKYVQSITDNVFCEIKNELINGHKVLFSGTPCQVAAVKKYVGSLSENLVTVDLICHGVPSVKMFKDYLAMLEEKHNGNICSFTFRDKKKGWGMTAGAQIIKNNGKFKSIIIPSKNSSYFNLFLESKTYRESCYSCSFATKERIGDLTIGDYWGIEKAHPGLTNKEAFLEERGISCILVNTDKGCELINQCNETINLVKSTFDKVASENHQLKAPSKNPPDKQEILDTYFSAGFEKLEGMNKAKAGKTYYVNYLKAIMPTKLKTFLKRMM